MTLSGFTSLEPEGRAGQGRAGKGERENRHDLVNARSTIDQGCRVVTSTAKDLTPPVSKISIAIQIVDVVKIMEVV